jgi:hypothetical protein
VTQFRKAKYEYELLMDKVNLDAYKTTRRKIHHIFPRASEELEVLIINFIHKATLHIYAHGFTLNRRRLTQAINLLVGRGLLSLVQDYSNNGFPRLYIRTKEFEESFKVSNTRIKILDQYLKPISSNSNTSPLPLTPLCGQKQIRKSGNWLGLRSNPYEQTKISLSNCKQVFEQVILERNKGRLYAQGLYNYQNIPKEERRHILIDGKETVEVDYRSHHANIILNTEGIPSEKMFYEKILKSLGFRSTVNRRFAVKTLFNASLNIKSPYAFFAIAGKLSDDRDDSIPKEKQPKLISYLNNIRPLEVYRAIVKTYPEISNYICTGMQYKWLQKKDGDIIIKVCRRLIKMGVIPLPVHDSVIVEKEKRDICIRVMKKEYKKIMGFVPVVG